jgi:hypothetical protein
MLDKITVKISFPCSELDWQKLVAIRSMTQEGVAFHSKSKPIAQVESLSSTEEKILRAMNGSLSSETPLIDMMTKKGVGVKVNMRTKIIECVQDNPGISWKDCARKVSEQYNITIDRIISTINNLSYPKDKGMLIRTLSENGEPGKLYPRTHSVVQESLLS